MNNSTRNLSDLLIEYLELLGVEYVFGVPGAHISALYEALARSEKRGGPRAILTRHETGAANMADGYARETGKLGVCCATTGPGATNLLTGVASSFTDHTPLLVLTGQTPLAKFGMAAFQESSPDMMDTTAMLSHCTYYSSVISDAKQFEHKLSHALMTALRSPKGPVHLNIPLNISRTPVSGKLNYPNLVYLLRKTEYFFDQTAFTELTQLIDNSIVKKQRIVLMVGHDCADASERIIALAERINANIITTQRGKTWVNPYHPLVKGVFGYAGHQSARQALEHESVDLILAIGTGLGQWSTSTWDEIILNDKLVHIHRISDYFSRSPMARLHLHGQTKAIVDALLKHLENPQHPINNAQQPFLSCENIVKEDLDFTQPPQQISVQACIEDKNDTKEASLHPRVLVAALMQTHFPSNTRFIVDTTNWIPWTLQYFFSPQHKNYRLSCELAAMGWGIGAAVGTAFGAAKKTPVVCLVGDGGFLMNGQEITVAVGEKLTVIYIILNDSHYGMVQHRHRQVSKESIEFSFPSVDFAKMAQAMGAKGYSICNKAALQKFDFQAICEYEGPTVIDVYINPDITPPMGMF